MNQGTSSDASGLSQAGSGSGASRPAVRGGICPYCGDISASDVRCDKCNGPLDALSRQATQNDMGPWFIRDESQPFKPGCSYGRIREMTVKGRIGPATVLRGPSTRQFWMPARRVPGVANLLGVCHSCQQPVRGEDAACPHCHADFRTTQDRQMLGIAPAHYIPGRPAPEAHAVSAAAVDVARSPSNAAVVEAGVGGPGVVEARVGGPGVGGGQSDASEWAAAARRRGLLAAVLAVALGGTIAIGVLAAADVVYDIGLGIRARVVGNDGNGERGGDGAAGAAKRDEKSQAGEMTLDDEAKRVGSAPVSGSSPEGAGAERKKSEERVQTTDGAIGAKDGETTPRAPREEGGTSAETLRKDTMDPGGPVSPSAHSGLNVWDSRTLRGLR